MMIGKNVHTKKKVDRWYSRDEGLGAIRIFSNSIILQSPGRRRKRTIERHSVCSVFKHVTTDVRGEQMS